MIEEQTCLKFKKLTKEEPKNDYYINIQKKSNGYYFMLFFSFKLFTL